MTNMQHYMDDIHDLLDGLHEEMEKRMQKIGRWDAQIAECSVEISQIEEILFDTSKPLDERTGHLMRLAELKTRVRDLAERKCSLAEKNQNTVEAVYAKLSELAYHCKCEVEIDNPGCTEQRERLFQKAMESINDLLQPEPQENRVRPPPVLTNRRTREMSIMTDDDRASTRSATPLFGKEKVKKRVGRPRNSYKETFQTNSGSAFSSARSSMEREPNRKKMSKYMKKKQEKLRLAEEERSRQALEAKKEMADPFAVDMWPNEEGKAELASDDEQELLGCLMAFDDFNLPPDGLMEALDVTESGLYSMDMYPPDHAFASKQDFKVDNLNNSGGDYLAPTPFSSSSKRTNAATSSSSGDLVEKRKRNMLFGSIADTSFSGRPRKLTDRVTEMLITNREKEVRQQKQKRESEDWCICGGLNSDSEMMVECENKNCLIEWFHFDCVGLTSAPQNEWYCPDCLLLPAHERVSRRQDD